MQTGIIKDEQSYGKRGRDMERDGKGRRHKALILISLFVVMAITVTGCGKKSVKDKAIENVNSVKVTAYMQEDQKDVKTLKSDYVKQLKKTKSDKAAKKSLKSFKADLKTFPTRKDKIKAYKKLVLEQAGDNKEAVEKILKEYSKKLNNVKSNKELETLTVEINGKLTETTGQTVDVTVSQVETSTPAAKAAAKQASAGSSRTYTSGASKSGSSSAKSGSSSSSSSKQRVWVVDQAAWTETKYRSETRSKTVYRTSDGKTFNTAGEAQAYQDWVTDNTDRSCNWWSATENYTVQVPYTVTHPEQGHWEYR